MEKRQTHLADDSRIKILIVDDHPNTANMLARAISRLGSHVEVVSATSGLEALHHAEDGAADILVTDMMMPGMTGMELIEMLNDQPSLSPAVTYLLTAHDSTGVREVAQRLNVRDVIAKPVHPEWICELMSKTIVELRQSKSVHPDPSAEKSAVSEPGSEPKLEDLNINQLLWEVAKKFQPQADVKDQLLVVGKTETASIVRGNAMQLRQALRSLVWEAINNTPRGGTVILSSENKADKVDIVVRDTGYGNYSSQIDYQGLSVVMSIAEQHGGTMVIDREEGKGSCFTLSLPLFSNANKLTISTEKKPLELNGER